MRHRLSIACGAFQSLPRGGRWAGRKPGSDEGYLSQRIGCVLRQHRTTWNHPRDPSGEARHHEGQGASPGSALVHYGSLSAGSPHPSASRPPSPSGKALITLYIPFHDMLTKMSCRSLSIFNLYVLTFLFYCDKNFLYNNLITLYNERSVPHETHPSL